MNWTLLASDLVHSWKAGVAFLALAVLRWAVASQEAVCQNAQTLATSKNESLPTGSLGNDVALDAGTGEEMSAQTCVQRHATSWRLFVLEFVDSALIALLLVFLVLRPFVVQAFTIPSGSMVPTLQVGDKILVNKFIYRVGQLQRGDVVVFQAPPEATPDQQDFIKRVIALPGDVVEIHQGRMYLNGKAQEEPYVGQPAAYDLPPVVVEPGKVFVLGDNRNASNDSHAWGQLDASRIRGKAICIFWPPSRMGRIR